MVYSDISWLIISSNHFIKIKDNTTNKTQISPSFRGVLFGYFGDDGDGAVPHNVYLLKRKNKLNKEEWRNIYVQ